MYFILIFKIDVHVQHYTHVPSSTCSDTVHVYTCCGMSINSYPTISFTLFVSLSLSLLVIMRPEEMITDIDLHDNVLYSNHCSTSLNFCFYCHYSTHTCKFIIVLNSVLIIRIMHYMAHVHVMC